MKWKHSVLPFLSLLQISRDFDPQKSGFRLIWLPLNR
jgi:hypothetical protein